MSYCHDGDIELTKWGAVGLNLQKIVQEHGINSETRTTCLPNAVNVVDRVMMNISKDYDIRRICNTSQDGSITIANNTAYNGGGVLLCANSIIFLSLHVSVTIEENLASNFGGGIYAEFECSQAVPPCFYGTETNETSVFLVNNNASRAGDALYGGSIDSCYTSPNSLLINSSHKVPFQMLFQMNYSNATNSLVTSDPYKVCICNPFHHNFNNSQCRIVYNYTDVVYSGMTINVHAVVVGQRNGTVSGIVRASFNDSYHTIRESQESQSVESTKTCTNLSYLFLGNTTGSANIHLTVENAYFRTRSPNQFFHSTISFTVKQCPYGSELLLTKKQHCDCCKILTISESNIRKANVYWWLGFDNKTMIFCLFCPFDFCQISAEANISIKNTSTQDHQCDFSRTGSLCGACHHTNSNVLGSSLCRPCHSYTPVITFALTLLFAFVGLLLLVILLVLNLSVTEGTLNPIIFYMNVVRINDSVYSVDAKRETHVYKNYSECLWHG